MPTHIELTPFVLQAISELGNSAKSREITDKVVDLLPNSDELSSVEYPTRPGSSVLNERISWARSTTKLSGALEQPTRGMYLITDYGESLNKKAASEVIDEMTQFEKEYNRQKREEKKHKPGVQHDQALSIDSPAPETVEESQSDDDSINNWEEQLLARLHRLSPEGFEKFVIYLLKRYGLKLTHVGGSGDEGIDAIGTAPLSPVLSSRVAVQVKRYDPNGKPIGRETVALFQRDSQTKGAERAILVTLSRFTEPARAAAVSTAPTVDLIDGARLAALIRDDGESGVRLEPTVNEKWFDRFD